MSIASKLLIRFSLLLASSTPFTSFAEEQKIPVIDCHVHLWDISRPEGLGWIKKDDAILYRNFLPADHEPIATKNSVTGVVAVQAGQSLPDNKWNLKITEKNQTLYRGVVGNLSKVIGTEQFKPLFVKLCQDQRYVGYRLSGRYQDTMSETLFRDLKLTAEQGRTLDVLVGAYNLKEVALIAKRIPSLKIIVNHFGGVTLSDKPLDPKWIADFRALAKQPNVYCKVSAMYGRFKQQPAPKDLEFYRPILDLTFECFGEDRLVYGSDWPVTRQTGDYASVLELTKSYFKAKGPKVLAKLFHQNATRFYGIADTPATKHSLKLPSIFSNGMVLQRKKPVKIWGWGTNGDKIKITFADQQVSSTVSDGKWQALLKPMAANAKGQTLTISSGAETLSFDDVLVGDLWLCGGQSNMEWRLRSSRDADIEIPCAKYPAIRFFQIAPEGLPDPRADIPVTNTSGLWLTCTPETAGECSGVAYFFGRRLHRHLGVPVGLINAAWGGTMAQHWVTRETLDTLPTMKPYLEDYESKRSAWIKGGREEGAQKRFDADFRAWEIEAKAATAKGEKPPGKPNLKSYRDPALGRIPAGPLNAMIMPIAGLSIRGALFYQGENNSFGDTWIPFQETFPAVIADWRKLFNDDQLPFGIIQIAGWSTRRSMEYDMNHHTNVVREVQFNTWRSTPNTGLIVSFDANSDSNIHPRQKGPIGERCARWALSQAYGVKDATRAMPLEWQGPVYQTMTKANGKILITFEPKGAEGLRLDKADARGFYIAGSDQVFHHAEARVSGGRGTPPTVEVWSNEVPDPVAVRYASSNLPLGSLMNGKELPAYPFRTDDWPIKPHRGEALYQVKRK